MKQRYIMYVLNHIHFFRIARIKREKKEKDREQKDMELANRKHLANMRVIQNNLAYVIGLHPKYATEEV